MMTKKNNDDEYDDDEEDDEDGEVSSKLEKAMTIGGFIIGAIIICILDFLYCTGSRSGKYRRNCKKRMTLSRQNRKKLMIQ